jgi:hypothetical protein
MDINNDYYVIKDGFKGGDIGDGSPQFLKTRKEE